MKVVTVLLMNIFIFLFEVSGQTKMGYQINGRLDGLRDGVSFYLIGIGTRGQADTLSIAKSKDEKFFFKDKLAAEGQLVFLKMDTTLVKLAKGKRSWARLLLDHSRIQITGKLEEWPEVDIKGSLGTKEFNEFSEIVSIMQKETKDQITKNVNDSNAVAKIRNEYNGKYTKKLMSISNSYAFPFFALNNSDFSTDTLELIYNSLPKRLKDSYYGIKLNEHITSSRASETIDIGKEIPDFKIKMVNGELKSIKSIISTSKITLIDFWASWCVPCRKDIPNLKKVFAAYNEKGFNIVSVSIDASFNAWEKALLQENMPWVNGLEQNKVSKDIFGISAIPAQILVNNRSEILAIDYFRGGSFQKTKYILKDKKAKGLRGTDLFEVIKPLVER